MIRIFYCLGFFFSRWHDNAYVLYPCQCIQYEQSGKKNAFKELEIFFFVCANVFWSLYGFFFVASCKKAQEWKDFVKKRKMRPFKYRVNDSRDFFSLHFAIVSKWTITNELHHFSWISNTLINFTKSLRQIYRIFFYIHAIFCFVYFFFPFFDFIPRKSLWLKRRCCKRVI